MARETKVGLLVGMAIILVIGIVISDQLSVANQQNPTSLTQHPSRNLVRPDLQITDPRALKAAGISGKAAGNGVRVSDPSKTRVHRPSPLRPPDAMRNEPDADRGDRKTPPIAGRRHETVVRNTPGNGATNLDPEAALEAIRRRVEGLPPSGDRLGHAPQPNKPKPAPAIIHYVADGETLWEIADKYYGNGVHWKKIAKANPDVGPKGVVRKGMRLKIPSEREAPADNRGNPPNVQPPAREPVIARADNKPDRKVEVSARKVYVVRKGDTLWSIAADRLGSGARHEDIFALNKTVLRGDAGNLRPNMKLLLPTRQ